MVIVTQLNLVVLYLNRIQVLIIASVLVIQLHRILQINILKVAELSLSHISVNISPRLHFFRITDRLILFFFYPLNLAVSIHSTNIRLHSRHLSRLFRFGLQFQGQIILLFLILFINHLIEIELCLLDILHIVKTLLQFKILSYQKL